MDTMKLDDLPRFDESARPVWRFDGRPSSPRTGLGQRLREIHDGIREETQKLSAAVTGVIEGRGSTDTARSALKTLSLRQSHPGFGGFCTGYCQLLSTHHSLEDRQVFPALSKMHPPLKPVLTQLYREHEVVSELIERLDERLTAPTGEEDAVGQLQGITTVLAELLLSHLLYEESQLVAVLDSSSEFSGPRPPAGAR